LASRGLVLASAKFCRWRGVPGKTGVVGVGFWRPDKFWRYRCRYRVAVGMRQTAKCELHRQIWRFGVLAWRDGDALRHVSIATVRSETRRRTVGGKFEIV
jgi:hypothetical protein